MRREPTVGSLVPESAWRRLNQIDPSEAEQIVTLAAWLALAEQRFRLLYGEILARFSEMEERDLSNEADVLADAHHALTLLQESLASTSRRMLDVMDRVSRELGE
jgi:hypothetical protein